MPERAREIELWGIGCPYDDIYCAPFVSIGLQASAHGLLGVAHTHHHGHRSRVLAPRPYCLSAGVTACLLSYCQWPTGVEVGVGLTFYCIHPALHSPSSDYPRDSRQAIPMMLYGSRWSMVFALTSYPSLHAARRHPGERYRLRPGRNAVDWGRRLVGARMPSPAVESVPRCFIRRAVLSLRLYNHNEKIQSERRERDRSFSTSCTGDDADDGRVQVRSRRSRMTKPHHAL
jgi:hypothetical protein